MRLTPRRRFPAPTRPRSGAPRGRQPWQPPRRPPRGGGWLASARPPAPFAARRAAHAPGAAAVAAAAAPSAVVVVLDELEPPSTFGSSKASTATRSTQRPTRKITFRVSLFAACDSRVAYGLFATELIRMSLPPRPWPT